MLHFIFGGFRVLNAILLSQTALKVEFYVCVVCVCVHCASMYHFGSTLSSTKFRSICQIARHKVTGVGTKCQSENNAIPKLCVHFNSYPCLTLEWSRIYYRHTNDAFSAIIHSNLLKLIFLLFSFSPPPEIVRIAIENGVVASK